jgi:hypothetical protein
MEKSQFVTDRDVAKSLGRGHLDVLLDLDHQRVTTAAAVQLLRLSTAKYFGS